VTDRFPAVRVRQADLAKPADAKSYVMLLDAYARDPLGQGWALPRRVRDKVVEDLQRHPGARIFLAVLGDVAVGFATCFLGYSTFRAAPLLNIHDIAVLPEYRRHGAARALLRAIADGARREGCCKLTLEVREDNPAARALYAAAGFGPAQIGGNQVQYLFLEKPVDDGS
jgi:GNAT superfamily N-acetyltransferase